MKTRPRGAFVPLVPAVFLVCVFVASCKDTGKISATFATDHVAFLARAARADVEEVRRGLPAGSEVLAQRIKSRLTLPSDLNSVRDGLETTRNRVQDLRIAKGTFFALADASGTVLRNDQEQDRMAGRSLFASFPALKDSVATYVETTGSMPEASGVRAPRPDGQWIAASPVRVDGETRALYVTGWSWASYAYRLEFALRSKLRSELAGKREEHEPLVYVFILVGKSAFGAPVTPEVSAAAVAAQDPLAKTKGDAPFAMALEITGRSYGLAALRVPALGSDVAVAVLRSET
jgi:hypothetical protein